MLNFRILNIFNFLNLVVIPFPDALRCSSVDRGNWGGGGGGGGVETKMLRYFLA